MQLEQGNLGGKAWTTLFEENKMTSRGMDLIYIPPVIVEGEMILELLQEDIDSEIEKWKCAIIAYVIGGGAIERFIASQGKFISKPKVYYHNVAYFLIHFSRMKDREFVMYHMCKNRPVIIKPWSLDFSFDDEDSKTIHIWVKLPNLPLSC